jgi:pimeloyl-ACP methyl ester carboxylesterase
VRVSRAHGAPATMVLGGETIGLMVSPGMIRVAGLEIAYDRARRGPPLVLVHGAAGDAREWAHRWPACAPTSR